MTPQMGRYTLQDDIARMAAHIADLDAHTYNFMETLRTGEYFLPYPAYGHGTTAVIADRIYAHPFIVARALTIDKLAIHVTANVPAKIARLGIYADGTNLYPGALVRDYGTVSVGAIAVVAATADQSLTKGRYWLVVVSDAAPTLRFVYPSYFLAGLDATNFDLAKGYMGWQKAGVGSGALADPFVAGAAQAAGDTFASVYPHLKTLD